MKNLPLMPANGRLSVTAAAPVPVGKSPNKITDRPTGLLAVALAAALLAGCNAKDKAGTNNGTAPANQSTQSDQSNEHMGDDNHGAGTMHDGNGDDRGGGGMMQQGRGDNGREMDTMRHGMNNGKRGNTMMHRGMNKGHRMGM